MDAGKQGQDRVAVSIVIPLLNELGTLRDLVDGVHKALSPTYSEDSYEMIFVDDGSTDGSIEELKRICLEHSNIKTIVFRRNYGKSTALMAGFKVAKGEIIITMDADLQDEPAELPNMISKLNEGYDLVSGWKKKRKDPLEKVVASRIFNFIISRFLGVRLHDFNCGFKAYRSWCIKDMHINGNLYRFLPIFVNQQGGKITEIPVQHNPRTYGKSKFGLSRYIHGILDLMTIILITRFFNRPLYFFGAIGIPPILIGFFALVFLVGSHFVYLFTGDVSFQLHSRPMLTLSLGLIGIGLNVFLVGLLAEFLLQISSKNNPQVRFSILETYNVKQPNYPVKTQSLEI